MRWAAGSVGDERGRPENGSDRDKRDPADRRATHSNAPASGPHGLLHTCRRRLHRLVAKRVQTFDDLRVHHFPLARVPVAELVAAGCRWSPKTDRSLPLAALVWLFTVPVLHPRIAATSSIGRS